MSGEDWDRLAQFTTLIAVLALMVVVVWAHQARERARDDAVVRMQGCLVQMMLVDEEDRAGFTVEDFERLCPGVRDVLENPDTGDER